MDGSGPPAQVEGAGEGGARVSSDEAEVRIRESTLSRAEEERAPAVRYLCAGESVCEPQKTARRSVGSSGSAPYARLQRRCRPAPASETRTCSAVPRTLLLVDLA